MLPLQGPWIDSEDFTDADLLYKIGTQYKEAALGVLCNTNLVGDKLAQVAENAQWSSSNVDQCAGGAALVANRNPVDQVALVVAAAARSVPAARTLVASLSPLGHMALLDMCESTRFKGGANMRATSLETVSSAIFAEYSHLPGYEELIERVHGISPLNPEMRLHLLLGAAFKDPQKLLALTEVIASIRHAHQPMAMELSCIAYDQPDVVEEWVRNGGPTGVLAGLYSRHQDPDVLLEAVARYQTADFDTAMACSLSLPIETRAKMLGDSFARQLMAPGANAHALLTLGSTGKMFVELREAIGVHDFDNLSRDAVVNIFDSANNYRSRDRIPVAVQLEVLLNSNYRRMVTNDAACGLLNMLMDRAFPWGMPSTVVRELARELPAGALERSYSFSRRAAPCYPDIPVPSNAIRPLDAAPTLQDLRSGARRQDYMPAFRHSVAKVVAKELNTVAQLEALYRHLDQAINSAGNYRWHQQLLAEGISEAKLATGGAAAAATKFQQLIPSALGSL